MATETTRPRVRSWEGGGLSSLLLVSSAASVSPASRCQRRSSLPRFASEHGYRPRPEEPLGPKQQFVPERRRLCTPHPSRRYTQCHQYQKGSPPPRLPLIHDEGQSPSTCIKMNWCFREEGEEASSSPSPLNPVPRKTEPKKESADYAPHLHSHPHRGSWLSHSHQGPGLPSNPSPGRSSVPLQVTFRHSEERVQVRGQLTLKTG